MNKSISNNTNVYLHKIQTVVPETHYTQDFIRDFMLNLDGSDKQKRFIEKIYAGSAIEKRHTVIDDYHKDPEDYTFYSPNKELEPEASTKQRNDLFIKEGNRLSLIAAEKLLKNGLNITNKDITHLITISCTGFSAPGFDYHLHKELNLSSSVRRYNIGFMGCYAALTGLSLAQTICNADENARVLMVNVELCSLHFQKKPNLDTMVANAIFADGITAAIISAKKEDSSGNVIALDFFNSKLLNNSEEHMAWSPGDTGFDMKLSAYVPKIIETNISEILETILLESGIEQEDIDIWALHPGGKAIIEKVKNTLNLNQSDLQISYDVLREYGNMSSSTLMFLLERILKDNREGNIFAVTFGPGLTVETGIFRKIK